MAFLAPLFLAVLSAIGLLAAFTIPAVPPARAEGGLVVDHPHRLGVDQGRPRARRWP